MLKSGMLKYISKFVLEAMPSIVATVIGAYIVANYINPKTPDFPKAAAVSTENPASSDDKAAAADPSENKSSDAKSADAKASDGKASDGKASDGKAVKSAEPASQAPTAKSAERAAEKKDASEKKDANNLARAAIERLRGTSDRGRATQEARTAPEPARVDPQVSAAAQSAPRTQIATPPAPPPATPPANAVASIAPAPVSVAPPLPPPVIVAAPNYGRQSPAGQEANAAASAEQDMTGSASASRLVPPADIPVPPLDIQARASEQTPVEQVSIADHVVSTTKSFFKALTPH